MFHGLIHAMKLEGQTHVGYDQSRQNSDLQMYSPVDAMSSGQSAESCTSDNCEINSVGDLSVLQTHVGRGQSRQTFRSAVNSLVYSPADTMASGQVGQTQSINQSIRDYDEDEFVLFVSRHASGMHDAIVAVLVFVNWDYKSTLANFLVAMQRIQIRNLAMVCLDDRITDFVKSIGLSCFSAAGTNSLGSIWRLRVHMLHSLVQNNVSVLMSDTDAIWKKSPFDLLLSADIAASRGSFPDFAAQKFGATACMGFVFFRGSPKVAEFVKNGMLKHLADDDQVALNAALIGYDLHFDEGRLEYENSTNISLGRAFDLSVNFLDHLRFQRQCRNVDDAIVAHCFTQKTGPSKVKAFKEHKLWYLREDWDVDHGTLSFDQWVSKVEQPGA